MYRTPGVGSSALACFGSDACLIPIHWQKANSFLSSRIASNELKTSYLNHARLSSQPLSPTDTRQQHAQYSDHPTNTGSSNSVMPDGADSSSSNLTRSSSWVKEEDEEKRLALFGDVVEGKKRKFILVDDHVRGTRVRVRVLLDTVKMEEIPDSHLRTNSVYPRSYYPRQIHSPPGSPGHPGNWDDCESEDEDVEKGSPERRKSLVQELLVDGSEVSLPVPRMSRSRRQKELALNELGYRMSWSQAKTFNERSLFMQKSRKSPSSFQPNHHDIHADHTISQSTHTATR